jgi:ferredoxin
MSDVTLTIDGLAVTVPAGTTVFDAARLNGIAIPTLCHQQNETPAGVCRVCVVEAGGRVLTASCVRPAENKMVVTTNSPKVVRRAQDDGGTADGGSSLAPARASSIRGLRTRTLAKKDGVTSRVSPSGFPRAARTILRWPSRSITKPASCATAASAAATRSA